ncbi:MAG TPA: SufD family Fe-S cluster assembly protein [Candidatus Azoamicus sp.]
MKKNIQFIHENIIKKIYKKNVRSNIIKNYLIFYVEKNIQKKNITQIKTSSKNIKLKLTHLHKNSKKITLLNNNVIKIDNLNEIKIFTKINKELLTDIKNFFTDCMYPNLNLNYIANNLSMQNKIFIKIPKELIIEKPIHIINIHKKQKEKKTYKLYLILDENSKANILSYYVNKNKNMYTNINTNIYLKKNSFLNYKIINSNKKNITYNASMYTKQLKNSNLNLTEIYLENDNLNSQKNFFLIGKNSNLEKKAGYILDNTQCSIICKINHYENESQSKTIIKTTNVNSEISFKGHIEVSTDVEKTQSNLTCKGIMLSKNGSIEFKPELAINNNNIVCSHAATVGYIDKNVIRYMQSRGLKEIDCINTLIKIFFHDILNNEKILSKIINGI